MVYTKMTNLYQYLGHRNTVKYFLNSMKIITIICIIQKRVYSKFNVRNSVENKRVVLC